MRARSRVGNKKRSKEQVIPRRGGSAVVIFRELDASHNRVHMYTLEIINTDSSNDKVLPLEIKRSPLVAPRRRDPIPLI